MEGIPSRLTVTRSICAVVSAAKGATHQDRAPGARHVRNRDSVSLLKAIHALSHNCRQRNACAVPSASKNRRVDECSKDARMSSQTGWLYALCTAFAILVAAMAWLIRARRTDAFLRRNPEERLAERERASREMHDTLLQGIQGLILRFQAAAERIPPREPAREMMERADQVLEESRDRANGVPDPATKGVKSPAP
jgi:signal transduction histidine kinase